MIKKIDEKQIDFYQLVQNSLNAIMLVDPNGQILYYNKESLELLQATDLRSKMFKQYLHPSFHQICHTRLSNLFMKGDIAEVMEQIMVREDGEIINVETMAVPFLFNDSYLAQITIRDISKRKRAEELSKKRENLASLGQMSAGIAHEIRNPLTAVKGFVQLLKEETNHHYINVIESELEKALNTINNLLQVSKPDNEEEISVPINICKELEATLFLFQENFYRIKTEVIFLDTDIMFFGKKNILLKAFFNLIKNAIEAIEHDGKICIKLYSQEGFINIIVIDNGIGIPPEKIKLLGTPFFSTKNEGTGMGLTQVYTTIHEHGGNITVSSEVGKGTTFHIQFPHTEK